MKFGYTILYVADVKQSLEFYEKAFGLKRKFMDEEESYGEMITGDTALAFANIQLAQSNFPGGFRKNSPSEQPAAIEIAFVTDEVEAAYEKAIDAGANGIAAPTKKPWGQTVSYVRDINGVLVELCSPVVS